eukprot:185172_1
MGQTRSCNDDTAEKCVNCEVGGNPQYGSWDNCDCGWCINYQNITDNDRCMKIDDYCNDQSICHDYQFPKQKSNIGCEEDWWTIYILFIGISLMAICVVYGFVLSISNRCFLQKRWARILMNLMYIATALTFFVLTIVFLLHYNSDKWTDIYVITQYVFIFCPLLFAVFISMLNVFINMLTRIKVVVRTSGNKRCLSFLIICIIVLSLSLTALCVMNLGGVNIIANVQLLSIQLLIYDLSALAGEFKTELSTINMWRNTKFICCNVGREQFLAMVNKEPMLFEDSESDNKDDEYKRIQIDDVNYSEMEKTLTIRIWILSGVVTIVLTLVLVALLLEEYEACFLNFAAVVLYVMGAIWWKKHSQPGQCCNVTLFIFGVIMVLISTLSCSICDGEECSPTHYAVTALALLWFTCHNSKTIKFDC